MQALQSLDPTIFQENRLPARTLFARQRAVRELCLDGRWHFSYYDNPQEATTLFLDKGRLSEMQSIEVPSHWTLQGFGVPQYTNTIYPWDGLDAIHPPQIPEQNPTGCYARTLTLGEEDLDKDLILRFDGVDSALYLYVNGEYVGYKEDSFSPGEFLINAYVSEGENLISAMVLRYSTGSWLEDQDFWRLPGIFRSVNLLICEKTRITDLFVRPTINYDHSEGEVTCEVTTSQDKQFSYRLTIDGQEISHTIISANAHENETIGITLTNPRLWSAEEPNLYHYTLELKEHGKVVDSVSSHFGFRKIEVRGRTIFLNGKRLILRGVNRHEFDPYRGRTIDRALIEKDLLLMKKHNINALRTSHYPNHPYVYEACDRLGIYMMDEVNLETHGTWMVAGVVEKTPYTIPDDKQEWKGAVMDRAISMTMRDKNHPSILFYSCGNESYGGSIIADVATYFRSLDDNRLVHYEGIFHDRRYDCTSDVESRMYAKVEEIQQYLRTGYKPFLHCEFAHAMGNSVGNLDEYVALEDESEAYCGGFIWDFVDQSLIIDGKELAGLGFSGPTDGYFCINGLVDGLRNPSAKLEQVAYSYSPIAITIQSDTDRKGEAEQKDSGTAREEIIIRNKNLFTSTEQYDFLYAYTLDGIEVESGTLDVEMGPLESKAYPIPALKYKKREQQEGIQGEGGEYQLIVRAALKADTPWARRGHTIVSVGSVMENLNKREKENSDDAEKNTPETNSPLIAGAMHTGHRHGNFSFLIHHHFGQVVAIQHRMRNLLQSPIRMEFWRAPTDNDIGVNPVLPHMGCKLASLYQVAENFRIEKDVYHTTVRCGTYQVEVAYRFSGNKMIMEIEPPAFDSYIPCFGISFSIDKSYEHVSYYGNEMMESHLDRKGGNVLRRVDFNPYKDQKSYLHPQEYGNRFGVRSLTLRDTMHKGMTIRANRSFECSVLPYSCHELEEATYIHDLPNTDKLHVRILEGQSGVGGDDSWGAPVHEKYRYRGPREKWVVELEVFE
ncbi:MAG: glycoside hydrolase family 2 TIM barrel-domain containing protein [Sphaerochaeta sp.]|nr:glycoside hydrolase family 2 TIM barrel-domain containing protein [Sphaerochaeta sp.]